MHLLQTQTLLVHFCKYHFMIIINSLKLLIFIYHIYIILYLYYIIDFKLTLDQQLIISFHLHKHLLFIIHISQHIIILITN